MNLKKLFKQELLEQLYAPHLQCNACPLAQLGRNNIVFGEGNPNAKLMFIGEGPGRDEDLKGKPFIGRAGQLLSKALDALGLKREDVYITNIVKCRPPGNRTPTPLESETCKNLLLLKQIKIVRPRVICTLGAAAVKGLLEQENLKISRIRGKKLDFNGTILLPTYHPAYILRNPKELKALIADLELAIKLIHQ